jgi:hypothetical protein
MSGLKIDDGFPKIIPSRVHAAIDYIHAGTNFLAAALFRRRNPPAARAAVALGASVLANALMTDYELGVFRVYSFKVHGVLDYGVAAASAAIPSLLGIKHTPEARYFELQGAGETLIARHLRLYGRPRRKAFSPAQSATACRTQSGVMFPEFGCPRSRRFCETWDFGLETWAPAPQCSHVTAISRLALYPL